MSSSRDSSSNFARSPTYHLKWQTWNEEKKSLCFSLASPLPLRIIPAWCSAAARRGKLRWMRLGWSCRRGCRNTCQVTLWTLLFIIADGVGEELFFRRCVIFNWLSLVPAPSLLLAFRAFQWWPLSRRFAIWYGRPDPSVLCIASSFSPNSHLLSFVSPVHSSNHC